MSEIDTRVAGLSPLKRAYLAIEDLQSKLESVQQQRREPVAIIGAACRFPGAKNLEEFWTLLRDGIDAIREISPERWNLEEYYDADPDAPGKMYTRAGGFIEGVDLFDASFFGVSPREAVSMDPQQRLFLEVAWEALEHAGQAPDKLSGSDTGVFVGLSNNDYARVAMAAGDPGLIDAYYGSGNALSVAAGRLSYVLGLQGPSMVVDTACSSSLVALHLASQSLRSGECRMALAGGVNLILSPEPNINFCKARMLAPDGRCKTFDASADGFGRGEGCGVVVLKRLRDAVADGDTILAVISGSAVNQDGRTAGLTAPNGPSQESVIRHALEFASIDPARVSYVEAHGTGTSLGDPIEANALTSVLCKGRPSDRPLIVGSVKTNIGHLEAAAGIAGLIKVVLALGNRQIPPHLHFSRPSPYIDWEKSALAVPTTLTEWPGSGEPRIAGLSSFGFSGTNVHVLVQEPPSPSGVESKIDGTFDKPALLTLSAQSQVALKQLAGRYEQHLLSHPSQPVRDVCFTANTGRAHFQHRMAVVAENRDQVRERLAAFVHEMPGEGLFRGKKEPASGKIAFLFTGQGSQYAGMGRQLFETEPVFRDVLQQCEEILRPYLEQPLLNVMYPDPGASTPLDETAYTQPALFSFEYALARLWQSWGIEPSAALGHSVGEYVAACVAGVFSLDDGLRLIAERARLMQALPQDGTMAAVFAGYERIAAALAAYAGEVSVAAINGPGHTVISGRRDAVETILREFDAMGIPAQPLTVSHAFHSPLMDPVLEPFERIAASVAHRSPRITLVSNVTGMMFKAGEIPDAAYWRWHLRGAVRFSEGIQTLRQHGYGVFVEIGPSPALLSMAKKCVDSHGAMWLPSLAKRRDARLQMRESLAALYVAGADVDWGQVESDRPGRKIVLPSYPFQRERFWLETSTDHPAIPQSGGHPLLGHRLRVARPAWERTLSRGVLRYLDDHRLSGKAVLPASASVELAMAAAAEVATELSKSGAYGLEEIEFSKVCVLPEGQRTIIQTVLDPEESTFKIYSKPPDQSWSLHVQGRLRSSEETPEVESVDTQAVRARCDREITGPELYRAFAAAGMEYGPSFQGVRAIWCGTGEALAEIQAPEGIGAIDDYRIHPVLLDACFQTIAGLLADAPGRGQFSAYVPVELRSVRVYTRMPARLWSHAVLTEHTPDTVVARLRVCDETGRTLLDAEGLRCRATSDRQRAARVLSQLLYEYEWHPQVLPSRVPPPPAPSKIAQHTSVTARSYGSELELVSRYERLEPEIDHLCSAFIVDAFQKLGGRLEPGRRFSADEFAAELGISARYRDLLNRYLQILTEDGCLRWTGLWEIVRVPEVRDTESTWRDLFWRNPAFFGELTLLGRCGRRLAEILRGETDPLHIIFPDGSMALAEHLYQDSPSLRFYNTLVQRAIAAAVDALPHGTPLRLLEIGAGTGGMTARVLPVLPSHTSRYVYTDVSAHFFSRAQEKFRQHPFVEYRRLDIEVDPVGQSFEANAFDIVLASEALHATADLRQSIAHIKQLLAPQGLLVLLEAVRPSRWIDLVFGLTDGWWRFKDRDLRPAYPLLPLASWRTLLEESGFSDVVEASGRPENKVENAVIIGRRVDSPLVSQFAPTRSTWMVFADQGGAGQWVTNALRARGFRCVTASAGSEYRRISDEQFQICTNAGDMQRFFEETAHIADDCAGLLYFWNLDSATQVPACLSIAYLTSAARSGRLWIITKGAQSPEGIARPPDVHQAPMWGLGRVAANEVPSLKATLVDLGSAYSEPELGALVDEVLFDGPENEIAIRGDKRYVHRYVRMPEARTRIVGAADEPYHLQVSSPPILEDLRAIAAARRDPAAGEVEIRVIAAGLNFSDVLKSAGLYPPSPNAGVIGLECSGRVTKVGAGVDRFRVGEEVVAIAPHSLGSFVTTSAAYVALKPAHLSFEEAATIPIAFLTASYALRHVGRLSRGERVLVHSAAGGVGLAAVQLAIQAGAEVFATAGTSEKRDFLRALGIRHVMDSRSQAFANDVLEATSGRGVDVILNSLTGEAITKGLAILSNYGRFLEIGKRDISQNSRLGMAPFGKNISFFGIDLDPALQDRIQLLSSIFLEVVEEFSVGALRPLPHRVFPVSHATSAFRHMLRAQHIGKVVISFEEQEVAVAALPERTPLFREDATYLISGGLGGFGLRVARWMMDSGARNLVLIGRHGDDDPAARQSVAELRSAGPRAAAQIVVAKADVAQSGDVARVLADIKRSMPPLRGVVHAAMVLEDCPLRDLDETLMQKVCGPKIGGAWNLHTLTVDAELDFFVMFSSMSSVIGIPGQASYAAANAFLDTLAAYRRGLGLPALTIDWGYLGETGWVARQPAVAARLEAQGVRSFSPEEATAMLEDLLQRDVVQAGAMRIDWARWSQAIGAAMVPARFAGLAHETPAMDERPGGPERLDRKTLAACAPEERQSRLEAYIREQVAHVLGLAVNKVDTGQPIGALGLDSLMAVELKNRIDKDLGIALPTVTLLEQPSVTRLTQDLLALLDGAPSQPAAITNAPIRATGLSEDVLLSSAQRWMWCLHQLSPDQPWCNFPVGLRLTGKLNVAAFQRSLNEIVRRHDVLRTRVRIIDGLPAPSIEPYEPFESEITDLSALTRSDREAQMRRLAGEEFTRPFDLERGPVRVRLLRLGPEEHVALVTMHHIVTDGLSMEPFQRELAALYLAFTEGKPSPLPELPLQYADFARWEEHWLKSEQFEQQLNYWKKRLAGPPPVLEFPTDYPRSASEPYRGAVASLDLSAELTHSLRQIGRDEGCTLYMTLLAAYQTLLFRYTGQEDFTVGSFVSSRSRPELQQLIGCFVNHLVFRADVSGAPSFRELLQRVRQVTLEAYANQDVPFEMLLDALQVKRDLSRTPLFQVGFAYDPVPQALSLGDLSIADLGLEHVHSNFDFTLRIREEKDCVKTSMEYNGALFEAATIQRLLQTFETLLAGISAGAEQNISSLPLLNDAERRQLLGEWNESPVEAVVGEEAPGVDHSGQELEAVALQKLRLAKRRQRSKST